MRRNLHLKFIPDIPAEVIMGKRAYIEYKTTQTRIASRIKKRLRKMKPNIIVLERNKKGKLGIKMDRELNLTQVETFAEECGAMLGQRIIECNGIPVLTKKDIMQAMKKTKASKSKQITLTVLYDPLALTASRAEEMSKLSTTVLSSVRLQIVPKIEMSDYVMLRPSVPSPTQTTKRRAAERRYSTSRHALPERETKLFFDDIIPDSAPSPILEPLEPSWPVLSLLHMLSIGQHAQRIQDHESVYSKLDHTPLRDHKFEKGHSIIEEDRGSLSVSPKRRHNLSSRGKKRLFSHDRHQVAQHHVSAVPRERRFSYFFYSLVCLEICLVLLSIIAS